MNKTRAKCDRCQLLRINGIVCHELGCPNAWKDETRKCLWCGQAFGPEYREQTCCDDGCLEAYYGDCTMHVIRIDQGDYLQERGRFDWGRSMPGNATIYDTIDEADQAIRRLNVQSIVRAIEDLEDVE